MKINKLIVSLIALATAFSLVSCDKNNDDKKDNKENQTIENSTVESEVASEQSDVGAYLRKTAELYKGGSYTLKSTVTSTAFEGEIKLTRVVDGNNIYQIQEEPIGSYGVVSVRDEAYDFDNACGMYRKSESVPVTTVVEEVVDQNLPVNIRLNEGFVVEQYTFTGSTYITNIDFYFDEATEELKKYTMTYISEGQDNVTETRVIDSVSETVDVKVFDLEFLNKMTDFEELTESERQSFCKKVLKSKGVTSAHLDKASVTDEDLKTIEFDSLFNLVYTYGEN